MVIVSSDTVKESIDNNEHMNEIIELACLNTESISIRYHKIIELNVQIYA